MKRLLCLLAGWTLAALAFAQTPAQIVTRMEKMVEDREKEGVLVTVETKVPIVGSITVKEYSLGDKSRSECRIMGMDEIVWTDGVTEWTYISKNNKVTIKNAAESDAPQGGEEDMFSGLADGYDVTLKSETPEAWHLVCKKSADNTDKDAPKTIDLSVSKKDYRPLLLKTRMSGVTLTLREISFGVSEEFVTFRLSDYPGATVEDKRSQTK